MSILDNPTDVEEAKARIQSSSDDGLERDLAYWATTAHDHRAEHRRYIEASEVEKGQYHEAVGMQELIVDELRKRRDRRREAGG